MSSFAKAYGGSLYELAAEEGKSEQILAELDSVCSLFTENPQYVRLLSQLNIPKAERCALLDEAFKGKIDLYLLNLMKILCQQGTIRQLPACAKQVRAFYNADHGILEVTAACAVMPSEQQRQALGEKLSAITGKKVRVSYRTEPHLLGGIRLDMGAQRLDGTVENRLNQLRRRLSEIIL